MRTILNNVIAPGVYPLLGAFCTVGVLGWFPPLALAAEPLPELVDYGQLGAILGYVASDYGTAVGPTGVRSAQELSEQRGFLAEAIQDASALSAGEGDVKLLLAAAKAAADVAAPPDLVVPKVTQALSLLEQRHDLGQLPKQVPSLARGRELFGEACEACHATDGSGHNSLQLSTQPLDVRDGKQLGPLSPGRVFAAISYGVPGTAMPEFNQAYADPDRWSLAFYFMGLGHTAGAPGAISAQDAAVVQRYTLAQLAHESDDDLRGQLAGRHLSPQAQEALLSVLRGEAPYSTAVRPGDLKLLAGARQQVAAAARLYRFGDGIAARHAAIAAYLDDFEPYESALRAKDAALVTSLETDFTQLRAGIDSGATADALGETGADLERQLLKAEDALQTGNASVSFAAALAIALREGLEAALLLSALLALALKSGRPRARLAVHLGWASALTAGAGTWFASGAIIARGGQSRELTEGITVLVTAVLLLGASHWILAQASAKRLVSFLSKQASLLKGAGWGLGGLAFLAIYREMFEIVVFYRGLLLQAPEQGRAVGLGVGVGMVALGGIVVGFQRLVGRKLKLRALLITCGGLLCALAVVMVGEGVRSLQEAGVVGQHLVAFPEVPQLGLFATAQGLGAQALVLAVLGLSLSYSLLRSPPPAPAPPAAVGPVGSSSR